MPQDADALFYIIHDVHVLGLAKSQRIAIAYAIKDL